MRRSLLAVASFALLVTTAGCGGVLGDDETRTPYDVDVTPTPTPTATVTPDPVTVEPTEEPVRAPPRLAENLSNQIERLSVADSYTAQVEFTVTRDGTTRRSETVTYLVDNEAKRGLQNGTYRQPETGTEVVSVYHDPDVFRQREVGAGGEVEYRTPRVDAVTPPNMTPANNTKVRLGALTGGLETTALERDGTATFDGQEMVHYAATRPEAAPESAWDDPVEFRTTVLVADGLVRFVEVRVVERVGNGKTTTTRYQFELTEVGSTTVERPEWVGNATDGTDTSRTTVAE